MLLGLLLFSNEFVTHSNTLSKEVASRSHLHAECTHIVGVGTRVCWREPVRVHGCMRACVHACMRFVMCVMFYVCYVCVMCVMCILLCVYVARAAAWPSWSSLSDALCSLF